MGTVGEHEVGPEAVRTRDEASVAESAEAREADRAGGDPSAGESDAVAGLGPPPLYGEQEPAAGIAAQAGSPAPASAFPRQGELRFGELAVFQRFATEEQVNEALRVQARLRREGRRHKIGKIMIKLGYLSTTQAKYVLRLQRIEDPIEGYKLLERRGQGGMGVVYRAVQKSLRREVALKVLAPRWASHSRFLRRFFREAKLAGSLNHPNIVSAIDVGESNGYHYYAMEYVDGWSVAEMLREDGRFDEDEALEIVLQIAKALAHASERHIVHRDIKPENILVTPAGVAKLADLGLSKQLTSDCSITTEGKTLGTPFYVSPELARGVTDVDVRSDIYSLGATLYHMLSGEPPFSGDNPAAIMARHIAEDPIPIRRRAPGTSRVVARLLERMMAKDPAARYQSAHELVHDLVAIRKGKNPFEGERRGGIDSGSGRARVIRERRATGLVSEERRAFGASRTTAVRGALVAACAALGLVLVTIVALQATDGRNGATAHGAAQTGAAAGEPAQVPAYRVAFVRRELERWRGDTLSRFIEQERYAEAREQLEALEKEARGTGYEVEIAALRRRLEEAIRVALGRAIEQAREGLRAGKPGLALDVLRAVVESEDPALNERRRALMERAKRQLGVEEQG